MKDEEDYEEVANRELSEPFKVTVARARERMLNPKTTTDPLERVKEAKLRRDVDAYKKGLREGRDQALWIVIAVCVAGLVIISYFPD